MPSTQAFSVARTVEITPRGSSTTRDVSEDVVEIVIAEKAEEVDSATVKLDTSQRPHAVLEQSDIHIEVDDGNDTKTFDGFIDEVSDDDTKPLVTIDARHPSGLLDDTSLVGSVEEDNLFDVLDAIVDRAASEIRQLSFDPSQLKSQYPNLGVSAVFGDISIAHYGFFGVNSDEFSQQETLGDGAKAQLNIDYYTNNTGTTYSLQITGNDSDGNEVTATWDLVPGGDVEEAFGISTPQLVLNGGNERWDEVTGITTDIPDLAGRAIVSMGATVETLIQTEYDFRASDEQSVRDGIELIVSYLSSLDDSQDWEYYVDDANDEVVVQPKQPNSPATYVYREGQNVIRPIANRNIDGVRNFVAVQGSAGVNAWAWAYGGDFQTSRSNPFEDGSFPDSGNVFDSSPAGGVNDIDEINLRAVPLSSKQITSPRQAEDIAKKGLRELYETPVKGTAPVSGISDVQPGDLAEIYYPSRGIPQRVPSNKFEIAQVETHVESDDARTEVDFGTKRPNTSDVISALMGGGVSGLAATRGGLSNDISQYLGGQDGGAGGAGGFPVVGTITAKNDDGTFDVEAENGETYTNVRII